MKTLTCTFSGHADVYSASVERSLSETIKRLIRENEDIIFYVGGRGEFDKMAASAVRAAKARNPSKKIRLYLVEPYMEHRLNADKTYYEQMYDGVLIPEELIGVHPKAAIKKRNRLMVDWSDTLIAFVYRDFGGAYETLQYAERKGNIRIINLAG